MDKQVKKLWIAALKSGEYAQGKGRLRRGDSYCCLGVLCDLSIAHLNTTSRWGDVDEKSVLEGKAFKFDNEGEGMAGTPPYEVRKWAGLTTTDALYLSKLNDVVSPENDNFTKVISGIKATL